MYTILYIIRIHNISSAFILCPLGVVGLDNFNDYYPVALKRARQARGEMVGVYTVDGDINDAELLRKLFSTCHFTHVLHLAAQVRCWASVGNVLCMGVCWECTVHGSVLCNGLSCAWECSTWECTAHSIQHYCIIFPRLVCGMQHATRIATCMPIWGAKSPCWRYACGMLNLVRPCAMHVHVKPCCNLSATTKTKTKVSITIMLGYQRAASIASTCVCKQQQCLWAQHKAALQ